jgi:hypothetical protein
VAAKKLLVESVLSGAAMTSSCTLERLPTGLPSCFEQQLSQSHFFLAPALLAERIMRWLMGALV